MRHRFPKASRVTAGEDFSRIIGGGSFACDETLIVNALPTRSATPAGAAGGPGRLGVTIPRKTGNAVVRNRWKRLIREAYRLEQHALPRGFDFIVRPRRGASADFARVQRSMRRLTRRAASFSAEGSGARGERPVRRDGPA